MFRDIENFPKDKIVPETFAVTQKRLTKQHERNTTEDMSYKMDFMATFRRSVVTGVL